MIDHFGVTLEDIARTFAREHHLDYIKLGGQRQAWWEGFLGSYYWIARPLGLRPTRVGLS